MGAVLAVFGSTHKVFIKEATVVRFDFVAPFSFFPSLPLYVVP
jgi:hypothetical protein